MAFHLQHALVAAVLHNVGTVAVMLNAGRLLKFEDPSARAAHGAQPA
jgi:cation transport ATPase